MNNRRIKEQSIRQNLEYDWDNPTHGCYGCEVMAQEVNSNDTSLFMDPCLLLSHKEAGLNNCYVVSRLCSAGSNICYTTGLMDRTHHLPSVIVAVEIQLAS